MSGSQGQDTRGYNLRSLLQSSLLYSLSDLVLRLIGFFLVPLYTRAMTPDDYGIIGYTAAVTQILGPAVGLGVIGSLPALYHAYSGEERNRLISSVLNFTLLYALIATVLISSFGRPVFTWIGEAVPFSYVLLAVWAMFFTTFFYLPLGIFNMGERTVAYTGYSIGLSLLNVGIAIVFVLVLRLRAWGALSANVISSAIGLLSALVLVRRYYRPVIDRDKLKAILLLALPALPHAFSGTLARFADRLFLANRSGLSATGIYSLAMTISSIVLTVLGGATTALNPLFYRRAHQGDSTLPADWARLCSLFVLCAALVALGVALLGPELIRILTPPKYHAAIPLLPTLVLGQVLTGLYWLVAPCIGYTRKTWIYPAASFPALGINLVLNTYLVPRYDAFGAAWAMVLTGAVQFLICACLVYRYFPVPYEYRQVGKIVVMTSALFAASRLPVFEAGWVALIFKPVLLLLLPLALLICGFFSEGELESARRSVKRLWGTLRVAADR